MFKCAYVHVSKTMALTVRIAENVSDAQSDMRACTIP